MHRVNGRSIANAGARGGGDVTPARPVAADGRRRQSMCTSLPCRLTAESVTARSVHCDNSWLPRFPTHPLSRTCGLSFLASMSNRPSYHMSCRGHNVEMMVLSALQPCVDDGNAVHECRSGHPHNVRGDATTHGHLSSAARMCRPAEAHPPYRHPAGHNVGRYCYAHTTPHPDS